MPVSDTPRSAGPFIGDGSATSFPFGFRVFAGSDLLVQATTSGVITPLVLGTDYTVTLNPDQTASPGGTVVTTVALPPGTMLAMVGNLPFTQTTALPQGGNYSAIAVQNALDRTVMLTQQLDEESQRAFRVPPGDIAPALPAASVRAGNLLGFDGNGVPVAVAPVNGSAAALATDLTNGTLSTKASGQVAFSGALNYAVGTLGWALQQGATNVMWFANGVAINDGTTAADAAFAAARTWAGIGRPIFVPKGKYALYAQFSLLQSQKLIGESTLSAFKSNLFQLLSTINVYVGQGSTTTPAILLDLGSGVHGICFNHPNQAAPTATTPIQFGWTISTDTSKAYNIDDVTIRDVMFVNAYMGINLDNGGRPCVENVSGDCIAEGLRVDRMFDVGRLRNIHFWTFTYTPGTNLYNWIAANGRAFNFNRCDDIKCYGLFQLGRNVAFDFNDAGNGACWGDFVSCTSDLANIPVRINKMVSITWQGGTLIPNIPGPCITTSTDVSETAQGNPTASFSDVRYHTNGKCGAVITSSTGSFTFKGGDFESSEVTVINTSTAQVSVSDPKTRFGTAARMTVFGDGACTRFNGIPNPTCSTDVTPANLNMATFTAGVPDNWAFITGASANIANQGGGFVRLLYNSASALALRYILPAAIRERRSLYTLRVLIRYSGVSDGVLTVYCRRSDTTTIQTLRRFAGFNHGNALFYNIPVLVGYDTGAQSIDLEWSSASGVGSGYVEIAGLQLFECADGVMQQDVIDSTHRREFLDPLVLGPSIAKPGSNRIIQQAIAIPTAGTWKLGDRVLRNPQVVGQPKAWVCTAAGSPGTWTSEGNL